MKQTNNIPQIDKSKLTPEQRDKLDSYNQAAAQIKNLKDIADLADNIYAFLEDSKKEGEKTDKEEGALLMDMRDALRELNAKEMPETPEVDNKPIIDAVSKLEAALSKAIKGIDIKPVVKVDAPQVHLNPTEVDLKGIEKILKTDIPQAFSKAVASIPIPPKPDNSALLKAWEGISEQLVSIENATRMKPLPGTMRVTNPDGSAIGSLSGSVTYESRNDTTTDTNLVYLAKAIPGTATSAAAWQIKRYNKSAGHMSFADDVTTFTKVWDDRTSYTY